MSRIGLLAVFASACASLSSHDPTQPPDNTTNPPPADDTVTLTARSGALPQAGVVVIFQSADDSLVADVMTDAMGVATAKLPLGGTVTAIQPQPQGVATAFTYVGVKPGDKLELVGPTIVPAPVTVNVTVPNADPDPEITGPVTITSPCGTAQGESPVVQIVLDGCGAQTDFLVTDDNGSGSFIARNVAITPAIDISGDMYRAAVASVLGATNAPAATTVTVEKQLETEVFHPVVTTGALDVGGGPVDITLPNLAHVDQVVSATVMYPTGERQIVASRAPYMTTPVTVDVGAGLIALPSQPSLVAGQLAWSEVSGAAADVVLARLTTDRMIRAIVAPYAGTSLRIPVLPATHDTYNLSDADTPTFELSLVKITGGYDGVRASVFDRSGAQLAPAAGSVTLSIAAPTGP